MNHMCILMALFFSSLAWGQAVQIPRSIKQDMFQIEQRFAVVLGEECPPHSCYAVGCRVIGFDTLDEAQTASLPGLDDHKAAESPQYRLTSALCEFTYEPALNSQILHSMRQRVRQRVAMVGTVLDIVGKPLEPKTELAEEEEPTSEPEEEPVEAPHWSDVLTLRLIPFVPWFLALIMGTLATLSLIWGFRKLGIKEERPRASQDDNVELLTSPSMEPDPTPRMLMARVEQLEEDLASDPHLVEQTLRQRIVEGNIDELCVFLKIFGPDLLQSLREKAEYREVLSALSLAYAEKDPILSPRDTWKFLDRLERDVTAAKVRIDSLTLEEEFSMLLSLSEEELALLLDELTEDEALSVMVHAPKKAKDRIFAASSPPLTAKFIERVASLKSMPDLEVRQVARKIRNILSAKGDQIRMVRVEPVHLIEDALHAVAPQGRLQLLQNLDQKTRGLFSSQTVPVFLDEALPHLPMELVTEALLTISPEEAWHYMAPYKWSKDLLDRLSPRLADSIRQTMWRAPDPNSELADTARTKISTFVKKAHISGKINLGEINSMLVRGGSE